MNRTFLSFRAAFRTLANPWDTLYPALCRERVRLMMSRCTQIGSSALSVQLQNKKLRTNLCQSTTWMVLTKGRKVALLKSCRLLKAGGFSFYLHRKCGRIQFSGFKCSATAAVNGGPHSPFTQQVGGNADRPRRHARSYRPSGNNGESIPTDKCCQGDNFRIGATRRPESARPGRFGV
jgi:hypothetical protein